MTPGQVWYECTAAIAPWVTGGLLGYGLAVAFGVAAGGVAAIAWERRR